MKKRAILLITTIALFSTTAALTLAGQPTPPVPGAVPAVEVAPEAEAQTNVLITISRTIVNPPDAITIIGTASSEEEKEKIADALKEAAPGKTINNQLVVAGQDIVEPSGAEKDEDSEPADEKSDSPDTK